MSRPISNPKYWDDLKVEGRGLTNEAEGTERDLVVPDAAADRLEMRRLAEEYRGSVGDTRYRDPQRPEHQLQDVIDAYRRLHPEASEVIGPRGRKRRR